MSIDSTTTPAAVAAERGRIVAVRVLAVLLLTGVLLQPVFAGSFINGTFAWARQAHALGANATFGVAAVELVLVLLTPSLRRERALVGGLIGIGVVLTAIIGLGYASRSARDLVALHVPLGVLIAIGATHHVQSVFQRTRAA